MKVWPKTVPVLAVCFALWAATPGAAQSDVTPSSGAPATTVQPVKDNPPQVTPENAPPAAAGKADSPAEAPAPANPPEAKPGANVGSKPPAGKADTQKRYTFGPLDVIDIRVWGQNQVSGLFSVSPDGIISLPLVGEIKVDGLTAAQLKDTITARLKECCLNNPEVETSVAKINSKRCFFYGGVLKQGAFPLTEKTTIMDALSEVGFKDFAKPNKITVQRGDMTLKFNYNDFRKGKNKDKNVNFELENGDRIYVPE